MQLTKLKRTMQKSKSAQMTLKGCDAESVCRVNTRLDHSGGQRELEDLTIHKLSPTCPHGEQPFRIFGFARQTPTGD